MEQHKVFLDMSKASQKDKNKKSPYARSPQATRSPAIKDRQATEGSHRMNTGVGSQLSKRSSAQKLNAILGRQME